tara:strand:- start:276 stop:491 length:216 start_codon:yes stop_codon:yes gene_type:complete
MFTDEQILNLCYLAYGWERDEETDEMFLDSPVLFPFPYENWLYGGGIVPTYEQVYSWVDSRKEITRARAAA